MESKRIKISKVKCCVGGCTDKTSSRYRFPNPVMYFDIFQEWLKVLNSVVITNMSPDFIYRSLRVCGRHFKEDEKVENRLRGLKRTAVPSLYLPGCDTVCEDEAPPTNRSSINVVDICQPSTSQNCSMNVDQDIEVFNIATDLDAAGELQGNAEIDLDKIRCVTPHKPGRVIITPKRTRPQKNILKMVQVTRQQALTPKAKRLYTKLIKSGNTISKLCGRISDYQKRLSAAKKLAETSQLKHLAERVNSLTYTFILSQIRTQQQKSKGRRFTEEEKILALSLLKCSGKGYRLLSKIFSLPSKRTLTILLNKIPLHPGINTIMFSSLKNSIRKMSVKDRNCILIFDEMYLSTNIQYNQKTDLIEGLEDFGNERYPSLADHINVFMIKGIYRHWKQPICYTFSNGSTSSIKLKMLIKQIISELQAINLNVVATVCDQGAPNVAAVKSLIKESEEQYLREGKEYRNFGFEVNGKEIVPLFDTPHLFKGLRNNLLNKDLHFDFNGRKGIAKWEHLEQFYNMDVSEPIRICPKLTDEHILPKKIKKMKVKFCTQVFSYQVGSLMQQLIHFKSEINLVPEAADTGRLILFLDELFDSLNSSHKIAPSSKPLKGALTHSSKHVDFWKESLDHLLKMRYFDNRKNKFVSIPSLTNLRWTIRGFLYLKNKLLVGNQNYLLLRVFQQDALENFFGIIRSYNVRNTSPSVSHVMATFKALLVNNFMSSHSPGANCEEDLSEGLLDNLRFFLTGEVVPGCRPIPDVSVDLPLTIRYVAKKMLKINNCQQCRSNLLFREHTRDLEFIKARTYNASQMTDPGTYLTHLLSESLSRLFYLIPRLCHLSAISLILIKELSTQLNFDRINCSDHSDSGLKLCQFIVRISLYFWCKRVNLIARGKDEKFFLFVQRKPDQSFVDPIKLLAHKKYVNARKRSLKQRSE